MTDRRAYLAAAIRLYLELPGAARRASHSAWAIATNLYNCSVSLETLAHVFRLATLRRVRPSSNLEPVHSLAYNRTVLDEHTPDAFDPGYVDYVARRYDALFGEGTRQPTSYAEKGGPSDRR